MIRQRILFIVFLLCLTREGMPQSTILVEWNFASQTNSPSQNTLNNADKVLMHSLHKELSYPRIASHTFCMSKGWNNKAGLSYWEMNFSAIGCRNLFLSSQQFSSNKGPRDFMVQYSQNRVDWTNLTDTLRLISSNKITAPSGRLSNIPLPALLHGAEEVFIRWLNVSDISVGGSLVATSGTSRIGRIRVTTTQPITPTIYSFEVNGDKTLEVTPELPCLFTWKSVGLEAWVVHIKNISTNEIRSINVEKTSYEHLFSEVEQYRIWITDKQNSTTSDTLSVAVFSRIPSRLEITPLAVDFVGEINKDVRKVLNIKQSGLTNPISTSINQTHGVFSVIESSDKTITVRFLSSSAGVYDGLLTVASGTTMCQVVLRGLSEKSSSGLLITEYINGNNRNKALEFYNTSNQILDLQDFYIQVGTRGSNFGTPKYRFVSNNSESHNFNRYLPPRTCVVLLGSNANTLLRDTIENNGGMWATSPACKFTGNDVIGLFYRDALVDVIGSTNSSSTNFDVAGVKGAAANYVLRRKSFIYTGNIDWKISSGNNFANSEWLVISQDTYNDLGKFNAINYDDPYVHLSDKNINFGSLIQEVPTPYTLKIITRNVHSLELLSTNSLLDITKKNDFSGVPDDCIEFTITPKLSPNYSILADTLHLFVNGKMSPTFIPVKAEIITWTNLHFYTLAELQTASLDGNRSIYEEQTVNTSGVITAKKGYNLFIQQGQTAGIMVRTDKFLNFFVGDSIALLGVKVSEHLSTNSIRSITQLTSTSTTKYLKISSSRKIVKPIPLTLKMLLSDSKNIGTYESQLIRLENLKVVGYLPNVNRYYLQQDGYLIETSDLLFTVPNLPIGEEVDITGICYYDKNSVQILPRTIQDINIFPREEIHKVRAEGSTATRLSRTFYLNLPPRNYQLFFNVPKNCQADPPSGIVHDFTTVPQLKITLRTSDGQEKFYLVTLGNVGPLGVISKNHVKSYPNPIDHWLYLELPQIIVKVRIYNFTGELLRIFDTYDYRVAIPFTEFKQGIYYVQIENNDGNTEILKKIKK